MADDDSRRRRRLVVGELTDAQAQELFGETMPGIRCPLCGWVPRVKLKWKCTCDYHWNTFDTRGRCPGCAKQWEQTQCFGCHKMSAHLEWYVPMAMH